LQRDVIGAEEYGFSHHKTGGHMARSMMLGELNLLLASTEKYASKSEYREAIVDKNTLGKPTFSSREKTYRHLVELFTLDSHLALFQTLRKFALIDPSSLPLLALACAYCRDAQLRSSFELIERLRPGEMLPRDRMERHLEAEFPGRFSAAMKKSLAQNVNTTWTVAGHLVGKAVKKRSAPRPLVAATTYAMFVGYLAGLRGEILISSVFARLVGADPSVVVVHLSTAARNGWVRFRNAGGVSEIDFSNALANLERKSAA
jgi:hypothetical protein